jgi:hypothetical protein
MARFRSLEPPKRWPDALSASRSALASRGQSSRRPLAIVDGPVQQAPPLTALTSVFDRVIELMPIRRTSKKR